MRIVYTTGFAGHGFTIEPGQEADLPEDEARRLIEMDRAVPAEVADQKRIAARPQLEVETAEIDPAEGKRKKKNRIE